MDGTTLGGVAVARIESQEPAVNSPTSPQIAKPPTTRTETNALDINTRREILQQAILDYQKAGGKVELADLRPRREAVAIVLSGVSYCSKHQLLFSGTCQKCDTDRKAEP